MSKIIFIGILLIALASSLHLQATQKYAYELKFLYGAREGQPLTTSEI